MFPARNGSGISCNRVPYSRGQVSVKSEVVLINAISIDVEDYFQVSGFEAAVSRSDWDHYPSRVVENTRRILRIFDEHSVRATFFVLGWVAEKFPFLVREIDNAGHEIGSHSYWHRLIYQLTPAEFREDLRRSKQVLEEIISKPVTSYRAPSFSITRHSLWALDILVEEGIVFDSSIFPTRHDRYGIPNAVREIHPLETSAGTLWEFPMSVVKLPGATIPASGGGYFRLYPYSFTKRLLSQINRSGRPLMFYLHPWEIDPQQPVVRGSSFASRKRHRINLRSTESRLRRLLQDFRFGSMGDVFRTQQIGPDFESKAGKQETIVHAP